MDEVPISFDLPRKFTVDLSGQKDISIVTTGAEKSNFTVVLGVLADGDKLKPMVIFKRKTVPKLKFPEGRLKKFSKKFFFRNCGKMQSEGLDE